MSFKDLKPELMALQDSWGSEVQAAKAPKGADGAPFPVKVLLELQQPEQFRYWDVSYLQVLLVVEGPGLDSENPPLKVEFPQVDLPIEVRTRMSVAAIVQWRALVKRNDPSVPCWHLQDMFLWVQSNFETLLRLLPECVDVYMGADANDVSQRRYTIIPPPRKADPEPVVVKKQTVVRREDDSESDEDSDTEEAARKKAESVARRRERQEAKRRMVEAREAEEARQEAERKREEAIAARERGEDTTKPRQLSKKELEEKHKSKQGVRTSKTGPKAHKFAGEGSAIEKAATGKKKK